MNTAQVESRSMESHIRLQMIEAVFDYYIGEPYKRHYRATDAVTVYIVPREWAGWWRFWLT